jgi:ubiquinone/menaquinone biosynthesis C-methylase UbiE
VQLPDLSSRRREAEWMDRPNVDPAELRDSLRFIRRVNWLLLYTRATIAHLERFSRSWKRDETIRIIDFATGSADVPLAILRWADRKNRRIEIVGIDLHPVTTQIAQDAAAEQSCRSRSDNRLLVMRADAMNAPFADASFDYALTSMFLHHLDEEEVVRVLREMDRVARRGVIAADLVRHRNAYAWISLFTLMSNDMVRHDARLSVAQAFTRDEMLAMRDLAGVGYARYFQHFGHRFVLAGEKLS